MSNKTASKTLDNLTLYEAIMLLALCEKKGTISGVYVAHVTAAALIAELLMRGHIKVDENNKNKVAVVSSHATGDLLLDEALTLIATAKQQKNLKDWVLKLAGIKDLNHKVAQTLATSGIVAAEKEKVLWLFERRLYPEINPLPEQQLRQAMRDAVLSDSNNIEPKIALVIALAKSARLLPQVFSKQELKAREQRIKQLENGELVSQAAKEAVQAIEAALIIAVIIPAIIPVTIHS